MKKISKILCLIMALLCFVFALVGCDGNKTETEKNWSKQGAWKDIYVYKGEGELNSMSWDPVERKGSASIWNTNDGYASKYVSLYDNDPEYKRDTSFNFQETTGRHGVAFYSTDGWIWVRILWTDSVTFLDVKYCR